MSLFVSAIFYVIHVSFYDFVSLFYITGMYGKIKNKRQDDGNAEYHYLFPWLYDPVASFCEQCDVFLVTCQNPAQN